MLARVVGQVRVRLRVRSLQMPAVALASAEAPRAVADSWPPHERCTSSSGRAHHLWRYLSISGRRFPARRAADLFA